MKKIMFNDKYGLTKAVLERRKTQTRRIIPGCTYVRQSVFVKSGWEDNHGRELKPKYEVGEVVAIAQKYDDVFAEMMADGSDWDLYENFRCCAMGFDLPGNSNKMFVRGELMPHHIEITGIWVERLQSISNEDSLKEGIVAYTKDGTVTKYDVDDKFCKTMFPWSEMNRRPYEAYCDLINNISGKGTWQSNPFVWVYEFKLVD